MKKLALTSLLALISLSCLAMDPNPLRFKEIRVEPINCDSSQGGKATIIPTGGVPPYRYMVNSNEASSNVISFPPGTESPVSITVIDNAEDPNSIVTTVDIGPAVFSLVTLMIEPSCNNNTMGTVIATAEGATGDVIFALDVITQLNDGTFFDIPDGDNILAIVEFRSQDPRCPGPLTFVFRTIYPQILAATASATNTSCNGGSDGTIVITGVSGGTEPYQACITSMTDPTFKRCITPPQDTIFRCLSADTYVLTVTDETGCTVTQAPLTVSSPTNVIITSVTPTDPACPGQRTGEITINAMPIGPELTYSVTGQVDEENTMGSATFSNLAAGVFDIRVTNDAGDCAISMATLTDPEPIKFVGLPIVKQVTFPGGNDGTITLKSEDVSGGKEPFGYSINGEEFKMTDQTFSGLEAGLYPLIVQDSKGLLSDQLLVLVSDPTPIVIMTPDIKNASSNGADDGTITLKPSQVTGGTPGYTYSIDGNFIPVGQTFENLAPGSYTITVKDSVGFTAEFPGILITEPTSVQITAINTTPSFPPFLNNGTIEITAESNDSLEYAITAGPVTRAFQLSQLFTGLPPGTYQVTARQREVTSQSAVGTAIVDEQAEENGDNPIKNFIIDKYCSF